MKIVITENLVKFEDFPEFPENKVSFYFSPTGKVCSVFPGWERDDIYTKKYTIINNTIKDKGLVDDLSKFGIKKWALFIKVQNWYQSFEHN